MNKKSTISQSQLLDLLSKVDHSTPVTITAVTDARLAKKGNPHTHAYKVCQVNGMTGANYESSVNRQRGREGITSTDFQADKRKWGERIGPALVRKNDSYYLVIQPNPVIIPRPIYLVPKDIRGRVRLTVISKEDLTPWLPPNRNQEVAEAQGVVRPVIYRNYKLDNIAGISINGKHYRIRPNSQ